MTDDWRSVMQQEAGSEHRVGDWSTPRDPGEVLVPVPTGEPSVEDHIERATLLAADGLLDAARCELAKARAKMGIA